MEMVISDVIQFLSLIAIVMMLIVWDTNERVMRKQRNALWSVIEMNEVMLKMLVELMQSQAIANEDYETAKRCQDILNGFKK